MNAYRALVRLIHVLINLLQIALQITRIGALHGGGAAPAVIDRRVALVSELPQLLRAFAGEIWRVLRILTFGAAHGSVPRVLVVGGGPAGTTAAVAAARLGADDFSTLRGKLNKKSSQLLWTLLPARFNSSHGPVREGLLLWRGALEPGVRSSLRSRWALLALAG